MKELLDAVVSGNLESVKKILASGNVGIEERYGEDRTTLLMLAAKYGHLSIIEYLLIEKKADINIINLSIKRCISALGYAAEEGHLHVVRYLLEVAKPSAKIEMRHGMYFSTVLHCAAACKKSRDTLVYLCSKYSSDLRAIDHDGNNLLHVAVLEDCTHNVEFLARLYPEMLFQFSDSDYTPFHDAIFEGSLKHVKLFASLRPELLKDKSKKGFTPLLIACVAGKLEIVEYLLTEANPRSSLEETCPKGQTTLHWAAASGNLELIKFIMSKNKINEEQGDKSGFTPLHYAAAHGRVEAVQYFLSRGGSCSILNDMGAEGLSVLIAETQGDAERLRNLIIPTFKSVLDLFRAANKKSSDIDDLIARVGIGINGRIYIQENRVLNPNMYQGCTILHAALMKNIDSSPAASLPINPLLVIKLLEAGASLDIQNKEKISCFELLISQESAFYHALAYFYKAKAMIIKRAELAKEKVSKAESSKALVSRKETQKTSISLEALLAEYLNPQNDQIDVKKAHDQERIEDQDAEQIQGYLTRAAECIERKMSEEDKNLLLFLMGSFLAAPYSSEFLPKPKDESQPSDMVSPFPVAAYHFLSKVAKTNTIHFVKANELLYQLLASGQVHLEINSGETKSRAESEGQIETESLDDDENTAAAISLRDTASSKSEDQNKHQVVLKLSHPETEAERVLRLEYLIKYAIHANSQYAVLGKNIAAYTQGESQSMMGIKGFVSFREPESCFALVKTMRQDHITLEQEKHALEQEKRNLEKENQALKAKHNAELVQMRTRLQEIEAILNQASAANQQNGIVAAQTSPDATDIQAKADKRNAVRRKSF